jgi:hypothetical protein
MKVPQDVKTLEMQNSTVWMDENGIIYSVPKDKEPEETDITKVVEEMKKFRQFTGGQKCCIVIESNSNSRPTKKEHRDIIASELESVTKAMAIVTNSPLSRMVANLFFGLKPPPYPAKMFTNEKEAKEWILQYCDKK